MSFQPPASLKNIVKLKSSGTRVYIRTSEADPGGGGGPGPPPTTKNEAPAPKFYKTEAPEW